MATGLSSKPSFSRWRKWRTGFQVILVSLIVLAVVVMVNYLSGHYFGRFYLSSHTRIELSPQTVNLLKSLTNQVQVTLYYNKEDPLYSDIADLLRAYSAETPKITVSTVDYYDDPGTAAAISAKYHLGSTTNKNVVIFDCGGKTKVVPGNMLAEYTLEPVTNSTDREFRRKPVAFNGEMMFTSTLLAVTNPKPLKAYFLQGHGEPALDNSSDLGYSTFASILRENYVDVQPLTLLGTNSVPEDCNLLIVAGPDVAIPQSELKKIREYLDQSGRLFALFNAQSANQETGLEGILTNWGVKVWPTVVVDPDHMANGRDVVVSAFAEHPVVSPIIGSGLYMTVPRPVTDISNPDQGADAPKVSPIAFTGPKAYLYTDPARKLGRFSV
ncbi:MAG TPA: GldG family protein, partial [Verrucomicrobiae bacterium]|nr:GldG family protein [Verrucomicrobiae bacterium]